MSRGALMHLVSAYSPVPMNLVAIDRAEIDRRQRIINHNVINIYATEIETMDILPDERTNIVIRNCDYLMPEYILIDLNNQPDEITPEYIIQNFNFMVSIGNQPKCYPLQIMEYLSPSSIISGNILKIPINYNYFLNSDRGIPLISLRYDPVEFTIRHNITNEFLQNVKLIRKNTYLDRDERNYMVSNGLEYKTREVQTLYIESPTANTGFQIVNSAGLLNGFILRLNNSTDTIENIENIEIFFNNYSRQIYNRELINIYCQQLAPNAIYVPIDMNSNIRSDTYLGAANISSLDRFGIKIGTNLEQGFNATLYLTSPSILRIMAGMSGDPFPFNNERMSIQYGLEPIPVVLNRNNQTTNTPVNSVSREWQADVISFEISINAICPITYDTIDYSKGVCKCMQCSNVFGYNAFRRWITSQQKCPLCRSSNIDYKYYTLSGETVEYQTIQSSQNIQNISNNDETTILIQNQNTEIRPTIRYNNRSHRNINNCVIL